MSNIGEAYLAVIKKLAQSSPNNHYSNFILKGRIEKPVFHSFVGLYPLIQATAYNGGVGYHCYAIGGKSEPDNDLVESMRHQILVLKLPERVSKLQRPDNFAKTRSMALVMASVGMTPIAFIGFGETTRGDKEDVIAIWHYEAMSTTTALSHIQTQSRNGLLLNN